MNTDTLDREAYRKWWSAEGRGDLDVCPCGNRAGNLDLHSSSIAPDRRIITSRPGFCARHTLSTWAREEFAAMIADGSFAETDPTDEEIEKAKRVAQGRPRFDA